MMPSEDFCLDMGTLHRHNDFYTAQTVYSIPYTKPTHNRKLSAFGHFQRSII